MPINPNIAMGVQGLQLNNPLDAYAKMSQIQGMQNQNALAQYGLAKAQREDEGQNALALAVKESLDGATGEVNVNTLTRKLGERGQGGLIPKVSKEYQEAANSKTAGEKAKVDLLDAKLKQSRAFLDTIDPNDPNAAQQYIQWHEANHSDPILGAALAARGVTADQARARIMSALQQPGGLQTLINQSKLGAEKFIEMNKPVQIAQDTGDGGRVLTRPGLGGPATVVEGSEYKNNLSAKDKADLALRNRQVAVQEGQLSLARQKATTDDSTEDKKTKQEREKTRLALPNLEDKAAESIALIDSLVGDANLDSKGNLVIPEGGREPHPGFGQAVGVGIPGLKYVHGTDTAGFTARLKQAQGGAFLEAVQEMKGSGALSNAEGKSATQAIQRMDAATSEKEFISAARDFQNAVRRGLKNAKNKAGVTEESGGAGLPPDVDAILKLYPGK